MAVTVAPLASFPAIQGPLPGLTRGTVGHPPPGLGAFLAPDLGAWAARATLPTALGDPPGPTVVGAAKPWPILAGTYEWFDHVHVLPRTTLNYGRVTTQTDRTFEVFSAYSTPVVFGGAAVPAGQGLSIPNLPAAGTVLPPFSSLLDPASTPGVPVLLKLRAAATGPYSIDTRVTFSFVPGGSAELFAVGIRFELLPFDYESGFSETLQFATTILDVSHGREQRISRREKPRQRFDVTFLLDGDDRRRMQAILFRAQGRALGLPLWHERARISAATSIGATTIPVVSTADLDLRVGGFAMLWKNAATYDVAKIAAVGPTSITLDADFPATHAYAIEDAIMPLRVVRLEQSVSAARHPTTLEEFEARCTVLDNDTGALSGDLTPLATVYGRPLLDGPNVMFGATMSESYRQKIVVIDNGSGVVYQDQQWPRGKRGSSFGFMATTRAAIMQLRRMLYGLRGRQVAFWVPTFFPDLQVVATLASGVATMDVAALGYTALVQSSEHKRTLRVVFADGTSLYRRVLSSIEVSATVERLTLDATWPATKTIAEVTRVEFLELTRLDTDDVELQHMRIGLANATIPAMVVHDDP